MSSRLIRVALFLVAVGCGSPQTDGPDPTDEGGGVGVTSDPLCKIEDNDDGSKTITCDDGTMSIVRDGEDGSSCSVEDNGDGTKTIACEDGTTVTVSDGMSGSDGAPGRDGQDGDDGAPGEDGADGNDGQDGDDGIDGDDGMDAFANLIDVTPEPSGANCASGGHKIETGIDNGEGAAIASDGVLQAGEIDSTSYACNGSTPGCNPSTWRGLLPNLVGCDLGQVDLAGTDLTGVDMTGASLAGARTDLLVACPAALPSSDWSCLPKPDGSYVLLGPGIDLSGVSNVLLGGGGGYTVGSGADLRAVDMRNLDLSGADLGDVNISGADLAGANLSGANLLGVVAIESRWDTANLAGARLGRVFFGCPVLPGADWKCVPGNVGIFMGTVVGPGLDLRYAPLSSLDLSGASLAGSAVHQTAGLAACPDTLPSSSWACVDQPANGQFALAGPGAVLSYADLRNADLSGLNLTDAVLLQADLTGADLTGTTLTGVAATLLVGCPASLPDSSWSCVAQPSEDTFVLAGPGVRLGATPVTEGVPDLRNIDLSGTNLIGADFYNAHLDGANFDGADLSSSRLALASLPGATFMGADLSDADLRGANLMNADMTNATLLGASLTGAIFAGATWSNTICPSGVNSDANGGVCP